MKAIMIGSAGAALLVVTVHAQGERAPLASAPAPATLTPAPPADWSELVRPLGTLEPAAPARHAPATVAVPEAVASMAEGDVVDAHWMALTMWGEARGEGEEAMRAVGHVIDNRRRAATHGSFVTETVSAAYQFSAWNAGDPNREAMLNVLDLPRNGREYRSWLAARQLADEILAGRSTDPTGGALFYHTTAVAPRWSSGMTPVAHIGDHLFFRTAGRG